MERKIWMQELDRTAMWLILNAIMIGIVLYVGLIHLCMEFYILVGVTTFIVIGRQKNVNYSNMWVRIRTVILELLTTFLILGLLWRCVLWIVHHL
jgi:hypothetical protein